MLAKIKSFFRAVLEVMAEAQELRAKHQGRNYYI